MGKREGEGWTFGEKWKMQRTAVCPNQIQKETSLARDRAGGRKGGHSSGMEVRQAAPPRISCSREQSCSCSPRNENPVDSVTSIKEGTALTPGD